MKRILFYRITLIVILLFFSVNKASAQVKDPDNAILKIGERISIHSKVLNEDRDIWIYLPPNYSDKKYQAVRYPVLYVLDGDVHFQSLSGMVQVLGSERNGMPILPEMIIVAIPSTNPIRDLTPSHSLKGVFGKEEEYLSASGGGSNFLTFMKDELIPKIDSTYTTLPYRLFAGHSFGGTAVIHALYTIPETFNAYISIDPSLWWNDKELVKYGERYFNSADLSGKSFFLAQANTLSDKYPINNHYDAIKEFASLLEDQGSSDLNWSYQYYPNDTHNSVTFIAEYDALRSIFRKYYGNFGDSPTPKEFKDHYSEFSKDVNVDFLPPERLVQQLGRIALFMNKTSLAEEYFQMNMENYPQSSSAFADMGQLFFGRDEKKKALQYYERSLILYPGNEESKNKVNQLRKEIK